MKMNLNAYREIISLGIYNCLEACHILSKRQGELNPAPRYDTLLSPRSLANRT